MIIPFYKYDSTGNDFIVLDNRLGLFDPRARHQWSALCQRKNGVGADGVLFLGKSQHCDFQMTYLNADGGEVEMCGNGARALIHFAHLLSGEGDLILGAEKKYSFETLEGIYQGILSADGEVSLAMEQIEDRQAVDSSDLYSSGFFSFYIKSGVPHVLFFVHNVDEVDVETLAPPIRYDKRFLNGSNVNFVEILSEGKLKVRTYERGVEAETLSCGTGVTAAALAYLEQAGKKFKEVLIETRGGQLKVTFNERGIPFLSGPTRVVFWGNIPGEMG